MEDSKHTLYILDERESKTYTVTCRSGTNLRQTMLDHGISPYTRLTKSVNCGGRGLCATCGVHVRGNKPARHWHDKLAHAFAYPRLSCQILVEEDLHISIPRKWIWGKRRRGT